jgi:hypothetical protein
MPSNHAVFFITRSVSEGFLACPSLTLRVMKFGLNHAIIGAHYLRIIKGFRQPTCPVYGIGLPLGNRFEVSPSNIRDLVSILKGVRKY